MSMSFQPKAEEVETKAAVKQAIKPNDGFENHIMQCCKASEWELRKWLRKVLTRAGFTIYEDGYKTERANKEKRYETVHNMLAIRGNANICLAAHTDVCREHEALKSDSKYSNGEYQYWMYDRHENNSEKKVARKVEPVIKTVELDGKIRRVIQDKDCKLQVGGDDRLGVAINTWIALNTGYDMALYFPTDEEIGLKSARACEMEKLKDFELVVQVDRGNHSDELAIKIGQEILCLYDTAVRLLEIAYDLGCPRAPICGAATDVYALKSRGMIKEAVNMTCGYHNSIGANAGEYIEIEEARSTMKYVAQIVRDYYLHPAETAPKEAETVEVKIDTSSL